MQGDGDRNQTRGTVQGPRRYAGHAQERVRWAKPAPRREGGPRVLSACLVPSCAQRSDQTLSAKPRKVCLPWQPISVGCALIIPMIIQAILMDPTGAIWTDEASNVSSSDPSGAVQADAEPRLVTGRSSVRIRPSTSRETCWLLSARRACRHRCHAGDVGRPCGRSQRDAWLGCVPGPLRTTDRVSRPLNLQHSTRRMSFCMSFHPALSGLRERTGWTTHLT